MVPYCKVSDSNKKADETQGINTVARGVCSGWVTSCEQFEQPPRRKHVHVDCSRPCFSIEDIGDGDLDLKVHTDRAADFVMCSIEEHYRVGL